MNKPGEEINPVYKCIESLLNLIEDGIHVIDQNGKTVFYNSASERIDAMAKSQVIGKHISDVYYLDYDTSLLLKVLKSGKPLIGTYQNYTTVYGNNITIVCNTYPLCHNGHVVGAVAITKDITRLREMSETVLDLQQALVPKSNGKDQVKLHNYRFKNLVGQDPEFLRVVDWAKMAATTLSPVLLYGETGTGKELFAQSIHNASERHRGPFLAINCAAIPETLLESILFGTVKGAYTGATNRPGLFEQANQGTLFLDEINSMSLFLQAKLLRVIEDGRLRRVGDTQEIVVTPRIISATNEDPLAAIERGTLRKDLFYLLGVIFLAIPPLRHRPADVLLLTEHFLKRYNKLLNKKVEGITVEVEKLFKSYSWPGNVRELEHCIECAMTVVQDRPLIDLQHLPMHLQGKAEEAEKTFTTSKQTLEEALNDFEKDFILKTLEKEGWNISRTANLLGIKRQSLQYRLRKYGLNAKMLSI